jgi:hypothetical protein
MSTADNALFDYGPITERPPIRWPGGARVAFYVGLNVEHFLVDRPSTSVQAGMSPNQERAYLSEVVETIADATGTRPRGWLGPGLTETFQTPALLADLGLRYVLDWTNQLHADAEHGGRVMALALHPFVIGQPYRARYLDQALEYLAAQPGIWLAASDEIAEHYLATAGEQP